MRHIIPVSLLALVIVVGLPASAAEPPRAGGAGLHWNQAFMGRAPEGFAGGELTSSPGVLTCIGGVGFVVLKNTRIGGEGTGCFARDTGMLQAGAQIGGHLPVGETYVTAYAGMGYGWLEMESEAYGAHFVYVRPAIAIGLPLGITAVEVGLYGMFPFVLAQEVAGEPVQGGTFPHIGLLATVVFGDHPRQRRKLDAVVDTAEPQATENAVMEPSPETSADPIPQPDSAATQ